MPKKQEASAPSDRAMQAFYESLKNSGGKVVDRETGEPLDKSELGKAFFDAMASGPIRDRETGQSLEYMPTGDEGPPVDRETGRPLTGASPEFVAELMKNLQTTGTFGGRDEAPVDRETGKPLTEEPKKFGSIYSMGATERGPTAQKIVDFAKRLQFGMGPMNNPQITLKPKKKEDEETGSAEDMTEDAGGKEGPEFTDEAITGDPNVDGPAYEKLKQKGETLNSNVDSAYEASKQTKEDLFQAYDKIVPIEPVTPLRILGDLVRVGAAFAVNKNPGLALALSGAGSAIKNYDPAYRHYQARKAYASNLLEAMSATDLKTLEAKIAEGPEKRAINTQVGLAQIHESGEERRSLRAERAADRAGDRQLELQGLKTGKGSLLGQIQAIVSDSGHIKDELADINDDSDFNGYTEEEKMHEAVKRTVDKRFGKTNISAEALKPAEQELIRKLHKTMKKK